MSKGDVPISYIIAIILGIIVVALLGYWFYTTGGKFSGTASETACRGKLLQYCTLWSGCSYGDCKLSDADFLNEKNSPDCEPVKDKLGIATADEKGVRDACQKLLRQIPLTTTTTTRK